MNKINLILFFAIVSTILISCGEDDKDTIPTPTTPVETFSAKINGVSYNPAIEDVYVDTLIDGGDYITQIIADKGTESIVLQFEGKIAGTYIQSGPTSNPNDVAIYYKGTDSAFVCTNSAGGGTLTITKYDVANNKVSGTFSFKGKTFGSSVIKTISEGTFENVNIQ